jgi:gliding motility-associated-like protein
VIIEVKEIINHKPVAVDDYGTTPMYLPITIRVMENDWDPDGDSIYFVDLWSYPTRGAVEVNEDQTVTYIPEPGFLGQVNFGYWICDDGLPASLCDSAVVYIDISETPLDEIPFKIYNALTPNGDGDNDYWKILGIEYFPDNEIILMDRWGLIVQRFRGYNNSTVRWEGRNLDGELLGNGVYYYILQLKYLNKMYKGWVLLHR